MNYARDLSTNRIVHAENAFRNSRFVCAICGRRVYLPDVQRQRAHFRHNPGEGTSACENYVPSGGAGGRTDVSPGHVSGAEDAQEFDVLIDHVHNRWSLLIGLPEIQQEELGTVPISALGRGFVEVFAGREQVTRVSGLELRPGVGSVHIEIPPSLQRYSCTTSGSWPSSIPLQRWQCSARELVAAGNVFRLRGGEWSRLKYQAPLHWGEELLVITEDRLKPPSRIVVEPITVLRSASLGWILWRVRLPSFGDEEVEKWASRIGHTIAQRPWGIRLATPCRAIAEDGTPIYWTSDSPIFEVESPLPRSKALATAMMNAALWAQEVTTNEEGRGYVALGADNNPGRVRFEITRDRTAGALLEFIKQPTELQSALAFVPRLRVSWDHTFVEAWSPTGTQKLGRELRGVRVDPGMEGVRVNVFIWAAGKQRSYRSVLPRDAEQLIDTALPTATRIQVDAENLGFVEISFQKVQQAVVQSQHRLAWWEFVTAKFVHQDEQTATVMIPNPKLERMLPVEVGAVGLIRARIASRRRRQTGRPQ